MRTELERLRRRFGGHEPGLLGARQRYAVLCPLVERPDGLHLLFEVRAEGIRQGGEVCFPGGRAEIGESAEQCALRETTEELSIPPETVTLLGKTDFICNHRGFLLQPVVGLVSPEGFAAVRPAEAEVAEVFTVPLDFFCTHSPQQYAYDLIPRMPEDFPYEAVGISRGYPWSSGQVEIPIWQADGHAIWGMTARIVQELVRE
ncbi:MAG: CoA pyrophosphatase [Ruminococcaceae bacterium]|nr:CoA pyrophosphatase [Oscillospiraceae bacterium]